MLLDRIYRDDDGDPDFEDIDDEFETSVTQDFEFLDGFSPPPALAPEHVQLNAQVMNKLSNLEFEMLLEMKE